MTCQVIPGLDGADGALQDIKLGRLRTLRTDQLAISHLRMTRNVRGKMKNVKAKAERSETRHPPVLTRIPDTCICAPTAASPIALPVSSASQTTKTALSSKISKLNTSHPEVSGVIICPCGYMTIASSIRYGQCSICHFVLSGCLISVNRL
jgi:hypothetical protein